MPLLNMSDLDLNGILITEFPENLSLIESRERLEFEIEEFMDEMGELDDPDITPVISPSVVYCALLKDAKKKLRKMSKADRDKESERLFKLHQSRFASKHKPKPT